MKKWFSTYLPEVFAKARVVSRGSRGGSRERIRAFQKAFRGPSRTTNCLDRPCSRPWPMVSTTSKTPHGPPRSLRTFSNRSPSGGRERDFGLRGNRIGSSEFRRRARTGLLEADSSVFVTVQEASGAPSPSSDTATRPSDVSHRQMSAISRTASPSARASISPAPPARRATPIRGAHRALSAPAGPHPSRPPSPAPEAPDA